MTCIQGASVCEPVCVERTSSRSLRSRYKGHPQARLVHCPVLVFQTTRWSGAYARLVRSSVQLQDNKAERDGTRKSQTLVSSLPKDKRTAFFKEVNPKPSDMFQSLPPKFACSFG